MLLAVQVHLQRPGQPRHARHQVHRRRLPAIVLDDVPLVAFGFEEPAHRRDIDDKHAGRTDQDQRFDDLALLQPEIADQREPFFQHTVQLGDDRFLCLELGVPRAAVLHRALDALHEPELAFFVLIWGLIDDLHGRSLLWSPLPASQGAVAAG